MEFHFYQSSNEQYIRFGYFLRFIDSQRDSRHYKWQQLLIDLKQVIQFWLILKLLQIYAIINQEKQIQFQTKFQYYKNKPNLNIKILGIKIKQQRYKSSKQNISQIYLYLYKGTIEDGDQFIIILKQKTNYKIKGKSILQKQLNKNLIKTEVIYLNQVLIQNHKYFIFNLKRIRFLWIIYLKHE
ncbi:unnamed protein product [Paramecium sonneborni]|uniref:Uncharacterized protein n=1 Tax=Paramecium sonneborni TaxID=65129 RepID=A0A8S1KBZ8_9CILI|nr:unnamed protein product [Paramecium sonneborni]